MRANAHEEGKRKRSGVELGAGENGGGVCGSWRKKEARWKTEAVGSTCSEREERGEARGS